jgi:hypothetical protein
MAKFPSETADRGTVKTTDRLLIHNIDTGATEFTTVLALLTALSNSGIGLTLNSASYQNHLALSRSGNGVLFTQSGTSILVEAVGSSAILDFFGGKLKVLVAGVPEYADNAAAITGGLSAGTIYRTGDALKIVHA